MKQWSLKIYFKVVFQDILQEDILLCIFSFYLSTYILIRYYWLGLTE